MIRAGLLIISDHKQITIKSLSKGDKSRLGQHPAHKVKLHWTDFCVLKELSAKLSSANKAFDTKKSSLIFNIFRKQGTALFSTLDNQVNKF